MFPNRKPIVQRQQQPKQVKDGGCEVDIKKTKSGKKIRFKGKCSKEQIGFLSQENGVEIED